MISFKKNYRQWYKRSMVKKMLRQNLTSYELIAIKKDVLWFPEEISDLLLTANPKSLTEIKILIDSHLDLESRINNCPRIFYIFGKAKKIFYDRDKIVPEL